MAAAEALNAARRTFLRGERVEMRSLAAELNVSRVTLHRWVGNRDLLLGEVVWSLAGPALQQARAATRATGAEAIAETAGRYLQGAHDAPWLRAFLEREGEIALRVLTTDRSPLQRRTVEVTRALLEAEGVESALDLDDLAYIIVRIGESFLYTDVITGGEPSPGKARQAIYALLT